MLLAARNSGPRGQRLQGRAGTHTIRMDESPVRVFLVPHYSDDALSMGDVTRTALLILKHVLPAQTRLHFLSNTLKSCDTMDIKAAVSGAASPPSYPAFSVSFPESHT